ncbi:hypothetical protein [Paenarthrobacter sp. JL.01a]|uniref:hypothetical protein n=1 Tax=Paenarthrobacter sp. JL.01a TaxID=2979324 RepID=UPI0021C8EA4E|nr:hypothetical protein [Paenarthrobacter sp. JL.01a]UXM92535.1 hypothetical protein N5P29_04195 [Paenarthrobacter sp. JL.01a]
MSADELPAQWTIGVARQGPPPPPRHDKPRHKAVVTTESTHEFVDHYITAEEAITERVARLKENKTRHTREGMTVRYTAANGDHVTITYQDV